MESRKNLALGILIISFIAFIYGTIKAIDIVNRTQIGTKNGIYTSYVSTSKEIEDKAKQLTKNCQSKLCQVQSLLDFATNIPYHTTTFQRYSAQKTMQQNFGDCDDKSNMLISMLHTLNIEAYFVLVPKHIFVIVPIDDKRVAYKKGLWINGKKYYILESTAKGSKIGYTLKYNLNDIDVIVEPFSNEKIEIKELKYKV